jgi:YjbE family integral membrane protein
MESDGASYFLGTSLKVFFIDLLLSGDNAIMIALACRSLTADHMRNAVLIGTGVAIVLRVCLTMAASYLLDVPGLKLAGALALIVIAIKLIVKRGERAKINGTSRTDGNGSVKLGDGLWTAIGIIIIAYPALSLDSVVALAAVAQGHVIFLTVGLLASTPLLVYGSVFVTDILDRYPFLIPAGGTLLGWIAGEMGIADPVISNWVSTQAPALTVVMPLLGAVFVLLESRIVEQKQEQSRVLGAGRAIDPSNFSNYKGAHRSRPAEEAIHVDAPITPVRLARRSVWEPASQRSLVAALLHRAKRILVQGVSGSHAVQMPRSSESRKGEEEPVARAPVLVVGGSLVEQRKLIRAMKQLGQAVDVASDGGQALTMLALRHYGLLITDLDAPRLDAFELTARVREEERGTDCHLPIIGFVGHRTGGDQDQPYLAAGMDGCLSKAVVLGDVVEIVMRWLPTALPRRRRPSRLASS